ncbi:sigma-54-dependent Fis family transcriptional regulator [Kosakonia quasisacchari]|uniref:Sigma-54-dependent Fis family transcriptional regulator n=1 Tax=Kosakonia quasisacchari TaxID=2529380 RepID=A0A4R0HHE5_9ENTR|nr:sigma-54-dependent Fis family transcriptional regulator [Kosakonia quasisacchari]TCC07149.1 sigma-54-dependent Fis family transcriptional regulator [Kosakonia quasisacchari]
MPPRALSHAPDGLPCQLENSWQRSLSYGLTRDDDAQPWVATSMLKDARAENGWVNHLAAPLLARLRPELASHPSIMVLSDATGLVLETHGNRDFLQKAQRYALAPGNLWGEHARGTNAIGTALALQRHCEVSGGEHYLSRNAGLFCSAAPVFRPDGQIAGVLDLSTPAQAPRRDAAALIRRAVCQIEHEWATSALGADRWLLSLHHDPSVLGSAQELLLIFADQTLLGANKLAMDEFSLTPHHFGELSLQALFPEASLQVGETTLASSNTRRYYARQTLPARRYIGRGAAFVRDQLAAEKEKALRIVNAGIALCVTGETGCGKEYLARELYTRSQWRTGNFVAINCAALPEHLIESELFGYVPGAFTGASPKGYIGKCREAHGGVLFLDEIGDMPLALQTRLLRVLQEKKVTPLGANSVYDVNFTLICATHQDLAMRVQAGTFREDLLYRIQEFHLRIPPLREWQNVDGFIQKLWQELGAASRGLTLSDEVVATLAGRPWPGNVRQLLSQLRVLMALAEDGDCITLADLPAEIVTPRQPVTVVMPKDEQSAIKEAQGNMSLAAKKLGISRSTLYRRLEKRQASE